jgi:hypothetical protein
VSFYKELYHDHAIDESAFDPLFDGLPTLDPISALSCEGDISYDECLRALQSMHKAKARAAMGYLLSFIRSVCQFCGMNLLKLLIELVGDYVPLPAT